MTCTIAIAQPELVARIEVEYRNATAVEVGDVRRMYEITSSSGFDAQEVTCVLFEGTDGGWWFRYIGKNREALSVQTSLSPVKDDVIENLDLSSHPSPLPRHSMPSEGKSTYRYYIADHDGENGKWTVIGSPHPVIPKLASGKESLMEFFRRMIIDLERKNRE